MGFRLTRVFPKSLPLLVVRLGWHKLSRVDPVTKRFPSSFFDLGGETFARDTQVGPLVGRLLLSPCQSSTRLFFSDLDRRLHIVNHIIDTGSTEESTPYSVVGAVGVEG